MTISNTARPNRWTSLLFAAAVVALAACGSDSATAPQPVAKENLNAPVTQTTVALLSSATVTLSGAGAAFGAASAGQNVSLAFDATGRTPVVTVGANDEFRSNLSFGSCIFTISAVQRGTRFTIGQVITIPVCNIVIPTAGLPVGTPFNTNFTLNLGGFNSGGIPGTFTVGTGGAVTGGRTGGPTITVGTVTTGNPT